MFPHAAFDVASRRVAASSCSVPVNLDLPRPSHPEPLIVDEEPEDPSVRIPDLGVSEAASPHDVLPPAAVLSSALEEFRR